MSIYDISRKQLVDIVDDKKVTLNGAIVPEYNRRILVNGFYHNWFSDSILVSTGSGGIKVHYVKKDSININSSVFNVPVNKCKLWFDEARELYWIYNRSFIYCYNPYTQKKVIFKDIEKKYMTCQ